MNQLRLDPLSGRWIAVSTDRSARGTVFLPRQPLGMDQRDDCPFCPGHEDATPPALETYGAEGKWLVRVVPNRYPAFEGLQPFVVDHRGPVFTEAPASGIHEVLVFSPDHDLSWGSFDDHQCDLVMSAIRDRVEEHQSTPGLRYSQVIVNSGREAGASIEHPHGQLLGIPFVPRELVDEQGSFTRFAGGCLLCTAAASEERAGYRLVEATDHAVTFAPYWSGTPYEMLVVPRSHEAHLHRGSPDDLAGVGMAIRSALWAIRKQLGDIAYNVVFHAAPYRASAPYHWHVHILPKLTTRAGFELGTGVYINVVAPERAAEELRGVLAPGSAQAQAPENVAS
jgi:UDPglucose--hexose-1-phosphate uridylyltransferase